MKKLALVLIVLAMTGGIALAGNGAVSTSTNSAGSFEVKVQAEVVPNIAVSGPLAFEDMGSLAAGEAGQLHFTIPFSVHANTESVTLEVCATQLYKGGDSTTTNIIPIDVTMPVAIVTPLATQVGQPNNDLNWSSTVFTDHGLAGLCTVPGVFEAGTNCTFSIDLGVTVCWTNTNPELAVGVYTGYVQLLASVLPPGPNGSGG